MAKITPRSILKQNRKQEDKITIDNLVNRASSNNVADALKNLYQKSFLLEDIKPIKKSYKVVGRIMTAITDSNDWGTLIKAIYECEVGDILVVKCSDDKKAVWGEMASTAAKKHGLKATIIIGASRDTNEIIEDVDYMVFSKTTRSNAGVALNEGEIGCDIIVDNMIIHHGDYMIADCDGVVVIPKDNLNEVLDEVKQIKKFEKASIDRLLNGEDLDLILNL